MAKVKEVAGKAEFFKKSTVWKEELPEQSLPGVPVPLAFWQ